MVLYHYAKPEFPVFIMMQTQKSQLQLVLKKKKALNWLTWNVLCFFLLRAWLDSELKWHEMNSIFLHLTSMYWFLHGMPPALTLVVAKWLQECFYIFLSSNPMKLSVVDLFKSVLLYISLIFMLILLSLGAVPYIPIIRARFMWSSGLLITQTIDEEV
jgi:hypothetical protein